MTKQFQEMVRDMTQDALAVLQECLDDSEAPYKERRAAAELVLAHGHGSPVSRLLMHQTGGEGQSAKEMSLDQLMAQAQKLLPPVLEVCQDSEEEQEI